jgi:hypothetical protein
LGENKPAGGTFPELILFFRKHEVFGFQKSGNVAGLAELTMIVADLVHAYLLRIQI